MIETCETVNAQIYRLKRAYEAHKKWQETAIKCSQFVDGDQWDADVAKRLASEGRPTLTLNKIGVLIRRISGAFRMQRFDTRFVWARSNPEMEELAERASEDLAEIDEMNGSKWNESKVFDDGNITGRGFLDLRVEFDPDHDDFVVSERVLDPISDVMIDPDATSMDPSEWGYVIFPRWMSPDEVRITYGREAENKSEDVGRTGLYGIVGEWGTDGSNRTTPFLDGLNYDNFAYGIANSDMRWMADSAQKKILVVDCQHYRLVRTVRIWMEGDERATLYDVPKDEIDRIRSDLVESGKKFKISETAERKLWWTVTVGEILLWDGPSPYDTPTIVPYFPMFRRSSTRGIVADAIDAQQGVNKSRSVALHILSTTGNAPWMIEAGSLDLENRIRLEESGARPGVIIEYVTGRQPPRRENPMSPPAALLNMDAVFANDLREITGINESMLGQFDAGAESGRAIEARQAGGDIALSAVFDAFQLTREIKGRKQYELLVLLGKYPKNAKLRPTVEQVPASETYRNNQFERAVALAEIGVPIPPEMFVELSNVPRKKEVLKEIELQKQSAEAQAAQQQMNDQRE